MPLSPDSLLVLRGGEWAAGDTEELVAGVGIAEDSVESNIASP